MTVTQVRNKTRADRLDATERSDAWTEYLTTVRSLSQKNYDEVEDWAWARLQARLHIIDRKREGAMA